MTFEHEMLLLGQQPALSSMSSSHVITLTNVTEYETVCYSLPLIKGYVSVYSHQGNSRGDSCIRLRRRGANDNDPTETTEWPVVSGNFKCLASLQAGSNHFTLEYEDATLCLTLEFQRKQTDYHVLPVYIICKGDDGRFQSPPGQDGSAESACRRIALGARLIQSLTAEKLYESDLGRRTFQLARDMGGAECTVFHSKLTAHQVYDMEPEEMWEHFGRELMSSRLGSDRRKFLAFLSCTRYRPTDIEPDTYEETVARVEGHVALGGGGLAIFGTGCLHTWAERLDHLVAKFSDETKVDKRRFMDDSCYRGTYGSCFSTTLGSVCHELDHTFDLGHSKKGIMGRGFDNTGLVFTIGSQSRDANKNMVARCDAQHATVCFTRDLSVTYTVSSPMKRPRSRPSLAARRHSPQRRLSVEAELRKNGNRSPAPTDGHQDNDRRVLNHSKVPVDDLTFWEKSCAVLLRFHRWFAEVDTQDSGCIEFDSVRNIISSPLGVRVIELRGDAGLVLHSWEFLSTYIPKQFTLPVHDMDTEGVKMVVAEDSAGNILKEAFTTG